MALRVIAGATDHASTRPVDPTECRVNSTQFPVLHDELFAATALAAFPRSQPPERIPIRFPWR